MRLLVSSAAAIAVTTGLSALALAQPAPFEVEAEHALTVPSDIKWTLEIKGGPYMPQIDDEFPSSTNTVGPFAFAYGGDPVPLVSVELDRYFLWPEGQLGIGLSVGYTYKTATGFEVNDDNKYLDEAGEAIHGALSETTEARRYDGYRTVFKIYPAALSAIYRYTSLDERLGLPFVPYGKFGLAYYRWSFLRPAEQVDHVVETTPCDAGQTCLTDKTSGTSLGWQGTVGISFRGDRIDSVASSNLRNEFGVQHAGIFVEGTMASVGGELEVGDVTWAAGVNFEF